MSEIWSFFAFLWILNFSFCNFRRKSRTFWRNLKNLTEFLRKLKNEKIEDNFWEIQRNISLSSYFHFITFIFRKLLFYHFPFPYIIYSTPSSWAFFLFFSNVLSSSFPLIFLPISFQLSSLSVGHHIFPIPGQLFHSYFFCQMSHFQFSSLFDCFSAFFVQFLYGFVSYFLNSVPLISLMSCAPIVKFQIFCLFVFSFLLAFQFPFFYSIVSKFPCFSQYSVLPSKCSLARILLKFQNLFPIPFTSLICYSFPGGEFFLLSFFLLQARHVEVLLFIITSPRLLSISNFSKFSFPAEPTRTRLFHTAPS